MQEGLKSSLLAHGACFRLLREELTHVMGPKKFLQEFSRSPSKDVCILTDVLGMLCVLAAFYWLVYLCLVVKALEYFQMQSTLNHRTRASSRKHVFIQGELSSFSLSRIFLLINTSFHQFHPMWLYPSATMATTSAIHQYGFPSATLALTSANHQIKRLQHLPQWPSICHKMKKFYWQ